MLSSTTEKANGFGTWGRHDCLKKTINLHVGGEAVALLLRLLPALTLSQLGTNDSLQKKFKHTTNSRCLKKLQYGLLHGFYFFFHLIEWGSLPKPVRLQVPFLLDLTGWLSVSIATVLSDIYYSGFSSQEVGVAWPLECAQSLRVAIILGCSK